MVTSNNGIEVMHFFESCKLNSYPDPGSKDGRPWTIGWGHTGPEVVMGLSWTQKMADDTFRKDLEYFEQGILSMVKVPLAQGHFDALVSFAYNIGLGSLRSSTLLKKLNAADYSGAALEFRKWNKNDGKIMRGLSRRRAAEEGLFNGMSSQMAISKAVSYT
ncbi:lysozyme [Aeromonas jandaei]|uniref:lysozyme n=1 Tax=Aeromonas jandaei TaxID=650 RepID=UPI003BA048FF